MALSCSHKRRTACWRMSMWLLLISVLGAVAACPRPQRRTAHQSLTKAEILVGMFTDAWTVRQRGVYRAPALSAYVSRLGQRLASRSSRPQLKWTFRIIDSDRLSASALPGGYIHVNRSLLTYLNNEAELAALLCHEIGHIEARHFLHSADVFWSLAARLKKPHQRVFHLKEHWYWLQSVLPIRRYQHELEADQLALECLQRSGYPRRALFHLLRMLQRIGLRENWAKLPAKAQPAPARPRPRSLSRTTGRAPDRIAVRRKPETHVELECRQRIRHIRTLLGDGSERPLPMDRAFLRRLSGLIVAPDPSTGVLVGRRYVHPADGFQMVVPRGWQIHVAPNRLVAWMKGKQAFLLLYRAPQATANKAIQAFAQAHRQIQLRPRDLGGGIIGLGADHDFGVKQRGSIVAFSANGAVFALVMYCPKANWPRLSAVFAQTHRSLGPVARPVPRRAHPWRIRVRRAPKTRPLGDWTACGDGPLGLAAVRRVNRLPPKAVVKRGQWLKCVTRGALRKR